MLYLEKLSAKIISSLRKGREHYGCYIILERCKHKAAVGNGCCGSRPTSFIFSRKWHAILFFITGTSGGEFRSLADTTGAAYSDLNVAPASRGDTMARQRNAEGRGHGFRQLMVMAKSCEQISCLPVGPIPSLTFRRRQRGYLFSMANGPVGALRRNFRTLDASLELYLLLGS